MMSHVTDVLCEMQVLNVRTLLQVDDNADCQIVNKLLSETQYLLYEYIYIITY